MGILAIIAADGHFSFGKIVLDTPTGLTPVKPEALLKFYALSNSIYDV
jgi:hypothetical protein